MHVICKKTHILSNDSQLCNGWATKYPFFVITRGYVTHSKLWFDMTPQYTSKLYCAKISFLRKTEQHHYFYYTRNYELFIKNLIKSSIRHSKVGLVNVLLRNNFVISCEPHTTNLFMYTVYKYWYTTQWKIHVINNYSQFSNKWATKYPIFVIMMGYITHSILWRDIPP